MKCVDVFIRAVAENDGEMLASCLSGRRIMELRQMIGYLGGSGQTGLLTVGEYLQIITDEINEYFTDLFGDGYAERLSYTTEPDTAGGKVTVVFGMAGHSAEIVCVSENDGYAVDDYSKAEG